MNKNIFKTLLLSSAAAFSLVSCEMDQFPSDKIVTETAWQTVDDAIMFENGIYNYFKNVNGGYFMYTPDLQSDLFNATISYGNNGGDMHRWDFTAAQYDIEDTWAYNYFTINNCNNIIDNIDNIVGETAADSAILKNIKGEAYLMRAICYHTLALRFAKDYEPETAADELGLPLVLEMDPNGKPSRSSLEATYAQIKQDIEDARTNLATEGVANSYYFTIDVIDLFEARVDLYMHNYSDAVTLAANVIGNYTLDTDSLSLSNMWLNDESNEILFKAFQSVDERTNSIAIYLNYSTALEGYSPYFVPSKWVYDLYEDTDIRKGVYFLNEVVKCNDKEANDVYMLNKFPGNPVLKKTSTYEYYNMAKVFRAAEAYLIAAEASFMNEDEGTAIKFLNDLRMARGASVLTATGDELLKEIKNEWVREFVGEGQRLNDLKRWHDGMIRHNPQNETILMAGEGFTSLSKDADDMRFVWEIPNNDLNANSNLIPNWK